jgi:ferredoxin
MHGDEYAQNQAHAADKTPAESWLCIVFQHVFKCSIITCKSCHGNVTYGRVYQEYELDTSVWKRRRRQELRQYTGLVDVLRQPSP